MSSWDFLTGIQDEDRHNVAMILESVADLYGPVDLDVVMRNAVDRALCVTDAQRGLLLLECDGGHLDICVARDRAGNDLACDAFYSTTVVMQVRESGQPAHAIGANGDMSDSMHKNQLLSAMAVPLEVEGNSLGVLYVDSTREVRDFNAPKLAVFRALGSLVALAVEKVRLLAYKAEQDRIKRELAMARHIQEQLFPKILPEPPGFQLAAIGRPAEETSGDYYDAIELPRGELALLVGDVSNHGLGPALVMATTRASIHQSFTHAYNSPAQVIESVNMDLERDTPPEIFVSLFMGMLQPRERTIRYVSAGHPAPMLCHRDGSIDELPRTGMALGIDGSARYELTDPIPLVSGDVLMCYTDGIYEAKDPAEEMYGEHRLRESLARNAHTYTSANRIMHGVLDDLRVFVSGQPLKDDVTCLVMRLD